MWWGCGGCFPIHQPREALSKPSPMTLRPINDFTLAIEMKNDFPLVIVSTHTSSLEIPLARSFSISGKSEGAADCVYKFSFCIRQSRQSSLLWNRTDGQKKKLKGTRKRKINFLCSPHRSRFHGNRQFISLIAYPLASSGRRRAVWKDSCLPGFTSRKVFLPFSWANVHEKLNEEVIN